MGKRVERHSRHFPKHPSLGASGFYDDFVVTYSALKLCDKVSSHKYTKQKRR